MDSKYLIIGAGGTGGSIAGLMSKARKDVTLIARGDHLKTLQRDGMLLIHEDNEGSTYKETVAVKAMSSEEYEASGITPDVIFLCTKSYSVADIAPFINSVASCHTVIIPILNGLMMGDYVRKYVCKGKTIDGCIYIFGMKDGPGIIRIVGEFFRIIFGESISSFVSWDTLKHIEKDLLDSDIRAEASADIDSETVKKFSYLCPSGGTILYFDSCNGMIRETPEQMAFFEGMQREIIALAKALGINADYTLIDTNRKILSRVPYHSTSSLVRDIRAGHQSEFDTLVVRACDLGRKHGVDMPYFDRVIEKYRKVIQQ